MTTSTLPTCIDALVTLFTSVCAPTQVFDGQYVVDDALMAYVAVAVNDGDASSVDGWSQGWAPGMGQKRRTEGYSIHCQAAVWSGDGTMKAARDQAFALLASCIAAVDADPGLAAAQPFICELVPQALTDYQSPAGPVCRVDFDAVVSTDTTRISGS